MSLVRKIIFLLVCFLLLNVFSIYGFDYDEYFNSKADTSLIKKDSFSDDLFSFKDKVFNVFKDANDNKTSSFVLLKKDGVLEMSGTFKNQSDAQKIADFLTVNREGDYKFEDNRVLDETLLENLAMLITPFKDFFADNSTILVNENEVTISGVLKDANYKSLWDTLLSRVTLDLKTQIKLPEELIQDNMNDSFPQRTEVVKTSDVVSKTTLGKKEVQEKINNILQSRKISFERRSSTMTEDSKEIVKDIAKILKENPNFKVEVAGHTDSRGKDELNKQISQDRASSVKDFLISLGIEEKRVNAVGYGEEFPIAKDDENGLSEINRRVEFNILGE